MSENGMIDAPVTKNGVTIYPHGYSLPLPAELRDLPQIASRFGFKIITLTPPGGKAVRVWAVGTEDDYREAEAQRLGVKRPDVVIDQPEDYWGGCYMLNGVCTGVCRGGPFCYNAGYDSYYYCVCGF